MGTDVWVILLIGVVVIFGATKLPQIARNLGKAQGEFKQGLKEGAVEEGPTSPPPAAAPTPPPASTPPAASPTPPPVQRDQPTEGQQPTA
jgi:sec-independent protein translocase protein TatA